MLVKGGLFCKKRGIENFSNPVFSIDKFRFYDIITMWNDVFLNKKAYDTGDEDASDSDNKKKKSSYNLAKRLRGLSYILTRQFVG